MKEGIMRKKFAAVLAAIVIALGLTTAVAPAANAGWPGGSINYVHHYGGSPNYIVFWCDSQSKYLSLFPGQWSKNQCADTGGFLVHQGTKLFCGERYGITSRVFYPGWYNIGNFRYWACEMRYHAGSA